MWCIYRATAEILVSQCAGILRSRSLNVSLVMNGNRKDISIVTGSGSGIGRAIALKLAEDGFHVAGIDVDEAAARSTTAEIILQGGTAEHFYVDVTDQAAVSSAFKDIAAEGRVRGLVNSAGIACIGSLAQTSTADFERVFNVNVRGVYNGMFAVLPLMLENELGVIINMASITATVGVRDRFAYSMSKGAVLSMTLSVAKDYINKGIRCNCVSPARVHTPFVDNFLRDNYPEIERPVLFEQLSKSQPIGRMGTPEEVAALVGFLLTDEASFITGSNFPIDGGFVTLNN